MIISVTNEKMTVGDMRAKANSSGGRASAFMLLVGLVAVTSTGRAAQRVCSVDALPKLPDVTVSSATHEKSPAPHCKMVGVIGSEIGFELRLPDDWNVKFIMGGRFTGPDASQISTFPEEKS